jgi:RND family efflux transporter MFP subunit
MRFVCLTQPVPQCGIYAYSGPEGQQIFGLAAQLAADGGTMRRHLRFILANGLVLSGLCAVAGCKRQQAAYVPPPPPEVTVAMAEQRVVPQTLDFTGTTRGIETVEVRARVRGFIATKAIEQGQRVKKGDVLFTIDPRAFAAAVSQAEAGVASAKAALRLAEVTQTRIADAVSRNAAAQLELDRANAELDAARASVQLSEAQLATARLDLEFTEVRAPIDGRIGISAIEVGQLVGASEPTLLTTVVNDTTVLATYFISERQLLEIRAANQNRRPGEDGRARVPVAMALANDGDFVHKGLYRWGDNAVDSTTGTIKVEAEFENKDGTILPGLFVRLRSTLGEQTALTVPDVAVQRDANGAFVLVAGKEDKVERRNVIAGIVIARQRVLLPGESGDFGVSTTDRVIVNGLQRARPGAVVKPVALSSAAPEATPAEGRPVEGKPAEIKPAGAS